MLKSGKDQSGEAVQPAMHYSSFTVGYRQKISRIFVHLLVPPADQFRINLAQLRMRDSEVTPWDCVGAYGRESGRFEVTNPYASLYQCP